MKNDDYTKLPKCTGENQVLFTPIELAKHLKVSRRTVGNWDARGLISGLRPPGSPKRGRSTVRYDLWLVLRALKAA